MSVTVAANGASLPAIVMNVMEQALPGTLRNKKLVMALSRLIERANKRAHFLLLRTRHVGI